jgi:hypothetical protein
MMPRALLLTFEIFIFKQNILARVIVKMFSKEVLSIIDDDPNPTYADGFR